MNVDEVVTVHQLIGRIAYFHVAFVEPALTGKPRSTHLQPVTACCLHRRGEPHLPAISPAALADTAWMAAINVAVSLGVRMCRADMITCCAQCMVRHAAETIAETWLEVETGAYADFAPTAAQRAGWIGRVGAELAGVFGEQFGDTCAYAHPHIRCSDDPPKDRFPVVSELITLWHRPIGHRPVTSWLNHCADLDDIARVLHARRGYERPTIDRAR